MKRRWEVVARWEQAATPDLHHHVIPASEGNNFCRTWIGARLTAAWWNWRLEVRDPEYLPPARWVVRRLR